MKRRIFGCIILIVVFFTFSINAKALTIEEAVNIIKDGYKELYDKSFAKDIVEYDIKFDSNENRINFSFKYTCTGDCDGKVIGGNAENFGLNFYWSYNEDEKSIEYKNDGTVNDKNIYEMFHVLIQASNIIDKMGYDSSFLSNMNYNYEENKIEYETVDIPEGYETEFGSIDGKIIKRFKFSIEKLNIPDIKTKDDDEKEEDTSNTKSNETSLNKENSEITRVNSTKKIENPKTSDINGYLIILPVVGLSVLVFLGIKKLNKIR